MRIGYGFNRSEKDFTHADVERVWLDFNGTDRTERTSMLVLGTRAGDTIVLLAASDLGRGGELPLLRKDIRGRGMSVEVMELPTEPPKQAGRPSPFVPSASQIKSLQKSWKDVRYTGKYSYQKVCDMAEWEPNKQSFEKARQWLNNKFGPRGG